MCIHVQQVHNETCTKVPNALKGRDHVDFDVYGMEGVPEEDMQAHLDSVLPQNKKLKEEDSAASNAYLQSVPASVQSFAMPMGMPFPGQGFPGQGFMPFPFPMASMPGMPPWFLRSDTGCRGCHCLECQGYQGCRECLRCQECQICLKCSACRCLDFLCLGCRLQVKARCHRICLECRDRHGRYSL